MAEKPKLYYFNGRGRMESVRWLLAAAGVEFEEEFLETREQYENLLKDGYLLFQQVPMVEIDGLRLVQTRAILSYIATKHNLYGKTLKERALYCINSYIALISDEDAEWLCPKTLVGALWQTDFRKGPKKATLKQNAEATWALAKKIDMYVEGTTDLMGLIRVHYKLDPEEKEKNLHLIIERATTRYFPVYEKVLKDHGQHFLVGNQLTWADVQLIEAIFMVEEKEPTVLLQFPLLQAFKVRMTDVPTIKKFLQPGSQRKPPPDEKFLATANRVFNRK